MREVKLNQDRIDAWNKVFSLEDEIGRYCEDRDLYRNLKAKLNKAIDHVIVVVEKETADKKASPKRDLRDSNTWKRIYAIQSEMATVDKNSSKYQELADEYKSELDTMIVHAKENIL